MSEKAKSLELVKWQERLSKSRSAYEEQIARMEGREELYLGKRELTPVTDNDKKPDGAKTTPHVRNIVAELIEAQVSSAIPQPKVTARRKQDEPLAKLIEDMLRNELDRLPMETINDMQERTVPIQGGGFYHVEWDNNRRTHTTTGEVTVQARHPNKVLPQEGVYTSLEDMDYVILQIPTTKEAVKARYQVDVSDEGEEEPQLRSNSEATPAEDMVTLNVAYYHNGKGGIGKYAWVRDVELEDLEDYQARRLRRCEACGELEPIDGDTVVDRQEMILPGALDIGGAPEMVEESHTWHSGDPCPYCGGKRWTDREEEHEELWDPITTAHGKVIPGQTESFSPETGYTFAPTKIPYYKPNVYPLVLQRNVSVFGQLLGDSDVDKVADHQNTTNRMHKKILDRLVTAGTRVVMPASARHNISSNDQEVWYFDSPADAQMIKNVNFTGNLQFELAYLAEVYEEARQAIGITDSFQGRADSTATSGKAKQFAAAQSAGRMESKRVLKNAAYADLFQLIFQFKLAYSDERRPVVSQDSKGNKTYDEFDRYDFLEQDEDGQWYWNDQFLFSVDSAAPLANNRERLWEETISLFSAGCFGNPQELETLIALWTKMELLHYPGAADTRGYLEEKLEEQRAMEAQARVAASYRSLAQAQAPGLAPSAAAPFPTGPAGAGLPPEGTGATDRAVARAIDQRARQDAMNAVFNQNQ